MKRLLFPVRGPAKKSRNWFLNFTAVAALVALAIPASAQSISVTGVTPSENVATFTETTTTAGPPRSIVQPYKATAPRPRGPLALLVAEPQSPQVAANVGGVIKQQIVADEIVSAPTRSLPTITVSNVSVPSTNR